MSISHLFWKNYQSQLLKNMPSKEEYRLPLVKNSLVFILTSKCNFGCKHCMRDFNSATDLPMDIAEKALASAKKFGYKNVCLTGGEPTLHAHFKELVAMIMKHGYTLSMPTNGYNFKQFIDVFRKLKKNTFLPAFSLESTKKERHDAIRHNGSYDILLENFKICRDLNIPFRIISAISTANFDETLEIALFAKKKGAHSLSITTVLPCPRSEDNKLVLTQQKRKELLFIVQKIPSIVKIPILAAADICASSNIKMCTSLSMNEITIDMNGNLIHCCEMSNYDASQIARGGIITSLKDKTFVQAIKAYSEYTHKYACQRIDDYEFQKDADDLDFNSCFYCVNKLISHA